MTAIAPAPVVMNDATLKIGTNNYELTISTASLTPTMPTTRFNGIGGNTIVSGGTPTWQLGLNTLQDFETADALTKYALANVGTIVAAQLYVASGGTGYGFNVLVGPPVIGGDVNAQLASPFTWEVVDQPTEITEG
jgi:hypothetical protein